MNNILVILEGEKVEKRNVGVKLIILFRSLYILLIYMSEKHCINFFEETMQMFPSKCAYFFSYKFLKKNHIIYLIQWLKMQILLLSYAMCINVFRKWIL